MGALLLSALHVCVHMDLYMLYSQGALSMEASSQSSPLLLKELLFLKIENVV